MIEAEKKYEALGKEKAKKLAESVDHPVSHGAEGVCPNCGHFGIYDLEGFGLSASSIFYSMVFEDWRCQICEFESLSI